MLHTALKHLPSSPVIQIATGPLHEAEGHVQAQKPGSRHAIICDRNTAPLLDGHFTTTPRITLPGTPHADMQTVERIRTATRDCDLLIALGSGTINDLCKYTSFLDGKPYVVLPTAPSMNGYCSANASITVGGHKQSLPAHMPRAVLCDLEVLCAAPTRLIRSGLGDSLCRATCQADWLLSHLLLDTQYDPLPFAWLQPYEHALFDQADALMRGDVEAMELLITTLLVSGMGMVHAKGSYPASQGEHLIAHTMEMKHGSTLPATYHGEQIGVTTLTMARRQEALLNARATLRHLGEDRTPEESISAYFGPALTASLLSEYEKKRAAIRASNAAERLASQWPEIQQKLEAVMLPVATLEAALEKSGAPTTHTALGWGSEDYDQAVQHAHLIRNRFTCLDMTPAAQ